MLNCVFDICFQRHELNLCSSQGALVLINPYNSQISLSFQLLAGLQKKHHGSPTALAISVDPSILFGVAGFVCLFVVCSSFCMEQHYHDPNCHSHSLAYVMDKQNS